MSEGLFERTWDEAEADLAEHGWNPVGVKAWVFLSLRHAAYMEGYREGYADGEAAAYEAVVGEDE